MSDRGFDREIVSLSIQGTGSLLHTLMGEFRKVYDTGYLLFTLFGVSILIISLMSNRNEKSKNPLVERLGVLSLDLSGGE